MSLDPPPMTLRSEAETQAEFDALQRKLVPLWQSIHDFNQDPQTIVVVPSLSLDAAMHGVLQQAYEERFLFLLLLLRQPRARLIYVTSQAIHPRRRRLLPRPAAGRDREPRAANGCSSSRRSTDRRSR